MFHGIEHARIAAPDLDQAVEAYAALLGRAPVWRGVDAADTPRARFQLANAGLELGAAPDEGLVALAFATDDVDACAAALRARGIEAEEPRAGEDGGVGHPPRRRSVEIPREVTRGVQLVGVERYPSGEALEHPTPRDAEVIALDHVVVTTPDLDAALTLYGDKLGLRLALDRRFEARGLRILFFRLGGATVEVVGPLEGRAQPEAGDGFGGLAWRVGDADAARARLVAAGFDVSEVRAGFKPGTRVCTVRDGTCGVPTLLIGLG